MKALALTYRLPRLAALCQQVLPSSTLHTVTWLGDQGHVGGGKSQEREVTWGLGRRVMSEGHELGGRGSGEAEGHVL